MATSPDHPTGHPPGQQFKLIKNTQFQSLLFLALAVFFVGHFVLLSPSTLEEDFNGVRVIHPKDLLSFLKTEPNSSFPEVPSAVVPSYAMRDLTFYSTTDNRPNWKLRARKSNLYQTEQLIHANDVILELPDHTTVRSKEGLFYIEKSEGDFFGQVHTVFPDGTTLDSNFARVITRPVMNVEIPITEKAHGQKLSGKNRVEFTSMGLNYRDEGAKEIRLLSEVVTTIHAEKKTTIVSDRAIYPHLSNHLIFSMREDRPIDEQFVHAQQPDLEMKSRTLTTLLDARQKLQTITARGEVWMKDSRDLTHLTTATAGIAVYYDAANEIHLKDYPQVYQDGDTVTGEIIVFNRNKDTVEVRQSNAIYKQ